MKRIFLALAIFALILPAARPAHADVDVSIDFFYNNLSEDDGSWVEVADYGYCWQPAVAVSNRDWRPYADGYWAYTDVGWTWVSYESFGWATYHYGRWARVRDHGWMWVPGREWGPAWVSWRTGGDYVGWAPLPPRRYSRGGGEVVYEGRSIGGQVDIEFDIGPSYYNFVDVRYIGAPVLREHIYAPTQNIAYINNTVNVTNITYSNSVVYNHGPDYNRLSAYSNRPIQRLRLERQTNADLRAAAQAGSMTRVQGDALMVAAPQRFQKSAQPVAPRVVKQKIRKADLETGWMNVSDPKAKAELQQKMKSEDPKSIPPTKLEPQNPAALTAASPTPITTTSPTAAAPTASASPSVAPTAVASPAAARSPSPAAAASPSPVKASPSATPAASVAGSPTPAAIASPTSTDKESGRGKNRGQRDQSPAPLISPASSVSPAPAATATATPVAPGKIKRDPVNPVEAPAGTMSPSGTSSPAVDATTAPRLDNQKIKERDPKPAVSATPAAGLATPPAARGTPPAESTAVEGRGSKQEKKNATPAELPPSARVPQTPAGVPSAVQQAPVRANVPTPVPAAGRENDPGRGNRNAERSNVPPAPQPTIEPAPPNQERRPAVRQDRQIVPSQAAPQEAPADAPATAPEGRGRPEGGSKKAKKGDEAAPSPSPGQ